MIVDHSLSLVRLFLACYTTLLVMQNVSTTLKHHCVVTVAVVMDDAVAASLFGM